MRLGVRDAWHLVQPAGDDVGELVVRPDPDHRHQVELAGDRVDLADLGQLGDFLGHLGDALDLCPHQNDRGDHRMPPRLLMWTEPVARAGAYATTSGQALSCWMVRMPRCSSRRTSQLSTSAVARASASARWLGAVRAPKNPASVPSLQSATSSGSITRRASMTVSRTVKPGHATPQSPHPATRNRRSNGALWATSTQPRLNSSSLGSTAPSRGAAASIESLIPVSSAIPGGTGTPGSTSEANSPSRTNSLRPPTPPSASPAPPPPPHHPPPDPRHPHTPRPPPHPPPTYTPPPGHHPTPPPPPYRPPPPPPPTPPPPPRPPPTAEPAATPRAPAHHAVPPHPRPC